MPRQRDCNLQSASQAGNGWGQGQVCDGGRVASTLPVWGALSLLPIANHPISAVLVSRDQEPHTARWGVCVWGGVLGDCLAHHGCAASHCPPCALLHPQARSVLHAWVLRSGNAAVLAALQWLAGSAWAALLQQHAGGGRAARLRLLCPPELELLLRQLAQPPCTLGLAQLVGQLPGCTSTGAQASGDCMSCRPAAASGASGGGSGGHGWPEPAAWLEAEWGWLLAGEGGGGGASGVQACWWLVMEHGQWRELALQVLRSQGCQDQQDQQGGTEGAAHVAGGGAGTARGAAVDLLAWLAWPCDASRCVAG